MGARAIFRGFNRPSRVLMINQFGINIGFYMLMPYLADYLAGPLGLAAWAVGLVMGVRNFSQQGMFFVGGTLADRFGYKPLIIAGCLIRTGGFALLVVAQSLPSVLIAAAATGFAGALFNPAVRGYLAAEAGERKIEAFAMFNVFYQSGILLGPLVGLVLLALDFRITVLAAAGVFGLLTVAQLVALPQHRADSEREKTSILQDWRVVVRNRPFLTLAAAMTGCYALSFQIYLALPMQASILMPRNQYLLIAAMFAVSGLVAVGGQLRITRWFAVRWGAERSLVVGATILAASFIPVAVIPNGQRFGVAVAVMALVLSATPSAIRNGHGLPTSTGQFARFHLLSATPMTGSPVCRFGRMMYGTASPQRLQVAIPTSALKAMSAIRRRSSAWSGVSAMACVLSSRVGKCGSGGIELLLQYRASGWGVGVQHFG